MTTAEWEKMARNHENEQEQIDAFRNVSPAKLNNELYGVVCNVAMKTNVEDVRLAAIDLLKHNMAELASTFFSAYALKGTDRQRRVAFINLKLLGCRSKMEVVLKGLKDPNKNVQQAAAMKVGLYPDHLFLNSVQSYFEHNEYAFFQELLCRRSESVRNAITKIKSKFTSLHGNRSVKVKSS